MGAAAPVKLLHVLGLLAGIEATYGTAVALTSTASGIQMQFKDRNNPAVFEIDYSYDGDLGPSVGNLGSVQRVAPSGRSVKGTIPTRARGGGAAYSAVILPSVHNLLKAAGFDATVSTGAGSEKWTYTPTAPGSSFGSLTEELYTRGEKWPVIGGVNDMGIDFSDPSPPIWNFMMQGILNGLPTDVTCPSITYPLQTVQPALASSIALTLGNMTSANANVMSGNFALGRVLSPRVVLSSSGAHYGFVPGDRKPQLKVTLEATALTGTAGTATTTFDPYNLRDLATAIAVTLQVGTTQYNRYKIVMAQAQVIDAKPSANGPVGTTDLIIVPYNSTAITADDLSIVFD